jgi:hypothetical protein
MKRLFTFGCSFTEYFYPTWANILAYDLNIESKNLGQAGIGNVGIFHRIVEADLKFNFTENDYIFIFWSSWSREDRIKDFKWNTSGSILRKDNNIYDLTFVKRYWDEVNDIVKNSTAIYSANKMYNITHQATAFDFYNNETEDCISMFSSKENTRVTANKTAIQKLYLSNIPKFQYIKADLKKTNAYNTGDIHPSVKEHIDIANEFSLNAFNRDLNNTTKDIFLEIHNRIITLSKQLDYNQAVLGKETRPVINKEFPEVFCAYNNWESFI